MTILKHYFNRTFFGRTSLLFAVVMPLAIIHVLYIANRTNSELSEVSYISGLASFAAMQLSFMFVFDTGQICFNFFYKDLKQNGVRDRLLVTPISKNKYVLGIVVSTFLFIMLTTLFNLVVSSITIGARFGNLFLFVLTLCAISLIGLACNIFAFYIAKDEKSAGGVAQLFTWLFLGTSMFSGGSFPDLPVGVNRIFQMFEYTPIALGINAVLNEDFLAVLYLFIWVAVFTILSIALGRRRKI